MNTTPMDGAEINKGDCGCVEPTAPPPSNHDDENASTITFEVNTYDELNSYLDAYYEETTSHFVIHSSSKDFGAPVSECKLSGHGIVWSDSAYSVNPLTDSSKGPAEDGIPRMIIGKRYMQCQFGKDKDSFRKLKRKKINLEDEGTQGKKERVLKTPTKKFGCPAKISIRQIVRFPEFKINKFTKFVKGEASKKLRQKLLENRSCVKMELAFIGYLPTVSQHKYHDVQQDIKKEPVDDSMRIKICELYLKKYNRQEIRAELEKYVTNELFYNQEPPPQWRRRYHPTRKDVSNTIFRFVSLANFIGEQEVQMTALIDRWMSECKEQKIYYSCESEKKEANHSPEDEFFESDTETNSKNKRKKTKTLNIPHRPYLFCYQNLDQQRLMRRYTGVTYFLKCTDNGRCKKIIPFLMYVIVQQTNVDYQIVGVIFSSKLRQNGLNEGLAVIKDWNPSWKPTYFITDCSQDIQECLERLFPDARIVLSTHSCEQAWMKFLSAPANNLKSNRAEILSHLRKMMYSFTKESLTEAAALLEETDVWKNSTTLRDWFQSNWLHNAKNWVLGYRPNDMVILNHFGVTITECLMGYENLMVCFDGRRECIINTIENIVTKLTKSCYIEYKNRNDRLYMQSRKNLSLCTVSTRMLKRFPTAIFPICHHLLTIVNTFPDDFCVSMKLTGEFTVTCSNDQLVEFIVESNNEWRAGIASNQNVEKTELSDQPVSNDDNCLANCSNAQLTAQPRVTLPSSIVDAARTIASDVFDFIGFSNGVFDVSFGDAQNSCFCLCSFWQLFKIPCIHMLAVFYHMVNWQYDMLSPLYRNSNSLEVDYCCVTQETHFNDQETQTVALSRLDWLSQNDDVITCASSSNSSGDNHESMTTTSLPADKQMLISRSKHLTESIEQLRSLVQNKQLYETVLSDWEKLSKELEKLT